MGKQRQTKWTTRERTPYSATAPWCGAHPFQNTTVIISHQWDPTTKPTFFYCFSFVVKGRVSAVRRVSTAFSLVFKKKNNNSFWPLSERNIFQVQELSFKNIYIAISKVIDRQVVPSSLLTNFRHLTGVTLSILGDNEAPTDSNWALSGTSSLFLSSAYRGDLGQLCS